MHFSAIYVSTVFVQAAVLQLITILHILLVNCLCCCCACASHLTTAVATVIKLNLSHIF